MAATSPKHSPVDEKSYILGHVQSPVDQQGPSGSPRGSIDDTQNLVPPESQSKEKTNLSMASFNYINSIIGSGVIGMPYALHQAGFGLGLVLLLLMAIITDYSLVLMVRGAHLAAGRAGLVGTDGGFSYPGLVYAAFGQPGYLFLAALQFIYPFIAMVSYNIIVGDTLTKVVARALGEEESTLSFVAHREVLVAIATIAVTGPLCLCRDVARLARASLLSLGCVLFILICLFIREGTMSTIVPTTDDAWQFANTGIVPAIGIMAFAFMCHHNTFLLYESIEGADQSRWDKVTHASVATAFVVSLTFGVVGYATFTGLSQGDLLENYCWDDDLMNVARVLFCATILLTFPIECFVTRDVITSVLLPALSTLGHRIIPLAEASRAWHVSVTLALLLLTYLLSMTTDCLGIVLELNGVLAAVPLAYILPALTYCKLEEGPLLGSQKLPALATAVFGVGVAILGVISIAIDFKRASQCSHGIDMPYCMKESVSNTTSNYTLPY
ncbi:putative sodium-coupled neutral amino acid transporter 11 [Hetaerina americana]|uniref:putative sodium-coupled neutral amino acid transporter 11 n=1 Tax=Hetaerina americana TaxID=62018 RepID=UPI003A7F1FE9